MIKDTIEKIENKLKQNNDFDINLKSELLELIAGLKKEIETICDKNIDDARSIVNFTEATTHEVMKKNKNTDLINLSSNGLKSSVEGFEISHPKLTKIVNSIADLLSKIGI